MNLQDILSNPQIIDQLARSAGVGQGQAKTGLEALLLGRVTTEEFDGSSADGQRAANQSSGNTKSANYKLKCPSCQANLAVEEGCVKCYGCGFSQC